MQAAVADAAAVDGAAERGSVADHGRHAEPAAAEPGLEGAALPAPMCAFWSR